MAGTSRGRPGKHPRLHLEALGLLHRFYTSTDKLEPFPHMGRVVPELGRQEFRELIVEHKYRLIYKITSAHIFVIAIRHGRQHPQAKEVQQLAPPEEYSA